MRRDKGDLVISFQLSRPLTRNVEGAVTAFGWRADRVFGAMPKLQIKAGALRHTVYDQNQKLSPETVTVIRDTEQLMVRIPLRVLGAPQRLLLSARTYQGDFPLDWAAWRIIELEPPSP
ncbi:hypothetical protein HQ590_02565 [bacterium]|nr:hypothetical protein [bacterium]